MPAFRTLQVSIVALIAATSAQAQVTPADVWSALVKAAEETGQTVDVGETDDRGNSLTLRDVTFNADFPDGQSSIAVAEFVFEALGDGRVSVEMSESYPIAVALSPSSGESVELLASISHPGAVTIASGTPGAIAYDYEAPSVVFSLQNLVVDGDPVTATIDLTMTDVVGGYSISSKSGETLQKFTSGGTGLDFKVEEPGRPAGEGDTIDLTVQMADLVYETRASEMYNFMASPSDFPPDLSISFDASYGETSYDLSAIAEGESTEASTRMASGYVNGAIDAGNVAYVAGGNGLEVLMSGSQIPFPQIAIALAQSEFGLTMPMTPTDEAQPLGIGLRLEGLQLPDILWSMVDPGGAIPRDPADLVLSIGGTGRWFVDVMSPDFDPAKQSTPPGELETLTIDELRLSVAGAEVTGAGGFTIDNSGTGAFGPVPQPVGTVDFQVVGLTGLMETLVGIGLLPQEQAMMGQMMLGMFTQPGTGPDTVTSKIELTPDGAVLANGQRVR